MKKTVLFYGILGGALIAVLKVVEYRYLVLEHSLEIYGGIVALLFSALGIWLGLKLTRTRETVVVREVAVTGPFTRNETQLQQLGITPRELENTVKTHAARLFDKLSARRRTQAVQRAKEAGLIP